MSIHITTFTYLHILILFTQIPRQIIIKYYLMRKSLKGPYKYSSQAITNLYNTMQVLKSKRESYSLQLLKQFILFPSDESDSSERTISRYDKLLFNDEALHTMFKKL